MLLSSPSMTRDCGPIYGLYHNEIFRYCFWKCHNREDAEDLTQETFLRFFLRPKRGKEILNVRAFLYRIAHNLFVNQVRRRKDESLDRLMEAGFQPAINPWYLVRSHLDAEIPLKKLCTMKKPYRQVLHRRFILGLSPRTIAKMAGESPNSVSVRIFRGLAHLRSLLDDAHVAPVSSPLLP